MKGFGNEPRMKSGQSGSLRQVGEQNIKQTYDVSNSPPTTYERYQKVRYFPHSLCQASSIRARNARAAWF